MLDIREYDEGGIRIVALAGRLDSASAPALDAWRERFDAAAQPLTIIDFSEVSYLSSAGLRVILVANRHAERAGRTLRFCGLQEMVRQVFKTAGLLACLPVYPDRRAALLGESPSGE